MKMALFLILFALLGCSDDSENSAELDETGDPSEHSGEGGTSNTCDGTEGVLVGLSADNPTPVSPTDTSVDSKIASIAIKGDAKLGKLFCITVTLLDAEGKPVAAKAGGQTLTFTKPVSGAEANNAVSLQQLDKKNNTMIFRAQHTSVAAGESSVMFANLFTFDQGKIEVAAGTIKGSVNVGMIDLNDVVGIESLTFTDAGTNKLAIKLKEGQTIAAGYDVYFIDDNSGEVIPAAEGNEARPALDDTEKFITFSKDVTGDNRVYIFYGDGNTSITGADAICPRVASGEQVCPAHVTD